MADDAGAGHFGPGCSADPDHGDGSFNGMATAPVATAASANPLLKTLVAAVTKADLVDTLNSAEALTVFAPTDDAFAQDPEEGPQRGPRGQGHADQDPDPPRGRGPARPRRARGRARDPGRRHAHRQGSGEEFTVAGDDATVLCGNIPTANATVYVIDTVLMPAS